MAAQGSGPPTGWVVREARPEDAAAGGAIAVRAWEAVHDLRLHLVGAELHERLWHDWRVDKAAAVERHVRERFSDAAVATVGDVRGEAVIWFVTWHYRDASRSIAEIGNNAVAPDWQGRGVATALYGHALSAFRRSGAGVACVSTGGDPAHAPARRAYQKAGFRIAVPSVTYYLSLHPPQRPGDADPRV